MASPEPELELGRQFGQGLSSDPIVRDSVLHLRALAEAGEVPPGSATKLALPYLRAWRAQHPAETVQLEVAHRRLVDPLVTANVPARGSGRRSAFTPPPSPPHGTPLPRDGAAVPPAGPGPARP